MDNLDWLLAEGAVDFAVPDGPRFVADDENWRANIECVELGPSLAVFLNDIQVRRAVAHRTCSLSWSRPSKK